MHDGVSDAARKRDVDWSIGLDFGTAFSKAAGTRIMSSPDATLREVRPLRIGATAGGVRPYLVPSSLYLDRQRVHFGARAIKKLVAADIEDRELVRSFKRVLGASDFDNALNRYPPAAVDPDRLFRLGDLIVLYLAYLLALVDATVPGATERSRVRFTRPGWIPDRIAAAHEVMTVMFNRAHMVHRLLGATLVDPEGVDYAAARAALDRAQEERLPFPGLDGGIYEASAVGLCHYSDPKTPNYLMILDIGAGTTDAAALTRTPFNNEICIVRAGRRTIETAGDQFDTALIDLLAVKAKLKTDEERIALKNRVTPVIREFKEQLFQRGELKVTFRGRVIVCTPQELERRPAFKHALAEINKLYDECLRELVQAGRRDGARSIGIVLAGGGAHIPAIRNAITKRRWTGPGMRIKHLPGTPAWVSALGDAQAYEALFSQVSAAFGAAISAPEPADDEKEQPETTRHEPAKRGVLG
jgi:molecular chaperone DnaK (HSP70)